MYSITRQTLGLAAATRLCRNVEDESRSLLAGYFGWTLPPSKPESPSSSPGPIGLWSVYQAIVRVASKLLAVCKKSEVSRQGLCLSHSFALYPCSSESSGEQLLK